MCIQIPLYVQIYIYMYSWGLAVGVASAAICLMTACCWRPTPSSAGPPVLRSFLFPTEEQQHRYLNGGSGTLGPGAIIKRK